MNTNEMKNQIDHLAAAMEDLPGFGPSAKKTTRALAALRYAGMQEGAKEFECNECGQVHPFGDAVAVNRGDSANLVCRECQSNNWFEAL
jgi:uncharacterized protein CbrC (UPF0167 family)